MKKLDFTDNQVFDNHAHPMDTNKAVLDADLLAREFYHGMGDIPKKGIGGRQWAAKAELRHHYANLGVVSTMVKQLSKLLRCSSTLEEVSKARNHLTTKNFAEYIQILYRDAKIVSTVLDSSLPPNDPSISLIPGRVLRLFQLSPALLNCFNQSKNYNDLLDNFQAALSDAVKLDGYIGVKAHLAEEVGFGAELAPLTDRTFLSAKSGNFDAYKILHMEIFKETLSQCQELDIPLHLHTGMTGGLWEGPLHDADPFLLMPILKQPEYINTKVVLLHGAHPWFSHASALSHSLPHVWVDMSWSTPWISLRLVEAYREAISIMPLTKLIIGSGCHGTPEIAWLSAKTAKIALGEVLGDAVRLDLLDYTRAEEIGKMILHDNAAKLYGID